VGWGRSLASRWFLCKLPSYEKFSKLIFLIRLRDFLKGLNKSFKQKEKNQVLGKYIYKNNSYGVIYITHSLLSEP
jgi:hypothetical protein